MANEQAIRNRRGTLLTTVKPGRTVNVSTLTMTGYGVPEYGQLRDNNLVYVLENFYNTTPPINPIEGQLWFDPGNQLYVWTETGSPASGIWDEVVPPADTLGFNVVAGDGLVGGGFPTTSPAEVVISVGAGTGITFVGSPTGAIHADASAIDHDSLLGFVADEHLDHSTISISAGDGCFIGSPLGFPTPGVGDDVRYINQTKPISIHIGGGDGIDSLEDEIRTDSTVFYAAGSPQVQTISGVKAFQGIGSQIRADNETNPATSIAYTFSNDTTAGIYRSAADTLAFATAGTEQFTIRSTGVLRASTASYENLISHDDDIPNKKYVDDLAGSGVSPTENTHTGISTITTLTSGKKYLVSVYGVINDKGNVNATLGSIIIRDGAVVGSGTILAVTNSFTINWMDGQHPSQCTFVVDAISANINGEIDSITSTPCTYMVAVELGNT